jgi:hypothetical protein
MPGHLFFCRAKSFRRFAGHDDALRTLIFARDPDSMTLLRIFFRCSFFLIKH